MRRTLTAVLGATAIAIPAADALAATQARAASATTLRKTVVTKKVVGPAVEADRWGTVTINLTVRKTTVTLNGKTKVTRRWTDIGGSYTFHTDRSQYIMSQALPMLRQEALQSRSANVDLISGATYTSQAFEQSLQAALLKVRKV